jgi:hypothetical protein
MGHPILWRVQVWAIPFVEYDPERAYSEIIPIVTSHVSTN